MSACFIYTRFAIILYIVSCFGLSYAAPADALKPSTQQSPSNEPSEILERQLSTAINDILPSHPISSLGEIDIVLNGIKTDLKDASEIFETYAGLFQDIVSSSIPKSIPQALEGIGSLLDNAASGITIRNIAQAILNGLAVQDLTENVIGGYISSINSYSNNNPASKTKIYPKKNERDAPYDVSESDLRSALYFPPGYQYGQGSKQPVLFVPGTGAFGGVNFISNLGKLLPATGKYDVVYLNVPGAMYMDAQVNSEYIAYAINYVSAVSNNKKIAVIPWSQGNLDAQWAFQYWPSTREVVTDLISVSPDIHGTVNAYFLCPGFPDLPCPPSVIQQEYDSKFVATLRNGGGASAYVPTTSIYSITDEIVQPQYDPRASAFYQDTCQVGVTNNELQSVCPGQPAGSLYTHEGVLYNPITYALVLDALSHDGPGRTDRINLKTLCNEFVADGLSLSDVLATEGLIPLAAVNLFLYPQKRVDEPAIKSYAQQGHTRSCSAVR